MCFLAEKRAQVNIRLTSAELQKVQQSASACNLSVGKYAKQVLLKSKLIQPKFSPETQQKLVRQLSGIANNLNQLTRLANSQTDYFLASNASDLQQLTQEVTQLWQQLVK